MRNRQIFTYVEIDSALYGPDGHFLKHVYCPKAMDWNQLLADDPIDRSRGCPLCGDRVINLDNIDPNEAVQILKKNHRTCVFGSEKSVLFLRDENKPSAKKDEQGQVVIHTARRLLDINRAAAMGFWPDVRLIQYDSPQIRSKFRILQHKETGQIRLQSDFRSRPAKSIEDWNAVIDFTNYYPHYQELPLAAYLVPKNLESGAAVIVADPIEDIVGSRWNQGDVCRAKNIHGVWDGKRIVLDESSVRIEQIIG